MRRPIRVRHYINWKGCVMSFIHRQESSGAARRGLIGSLAAGAVACGLIAVSVPSAALAAGATPARPLSAANYSTHRVCGPSRSGTAHCLAQILIPISAAARARDTPLAGARAAPRGRGAGTPAQEGAFGLTPADLHSAYELPTQTGSSQTIAIVDAYDDPSAEQDLAVYDEEFGLPPCTTANGCFTKVNQDGHTAPLPEAEAGWAVEISLDVQMAHSICQNCKIKLVESSSNSFGDMETAENTAVRVGATEVSNSYGGYPGYESGAYDYPGVVITASSGDYGWQEPAQYPASSPSVVAVGGTTLRLNERAWQGETAWVGGGSGCNPFAPAQPWQLAVSDWSRVGCGVNRATVDVAAVADPWTGVAVYDSFGVGGWITLGGTSVASPVIAATYALAGGSHGVAYPASTLYSHLGGSGLHDVTEGSNGECGQLLICNAAVGYDGPTGVGTPHGLSAFIPQIPPTVTGVAPAQGSTDGGTVVTLSGTSLGGARAVEFGGTPASISADSATSITVTAPKHLAGTVAITVTGAEGTQSAESPTDQFVYAAPASGGGGGGTGGGGGSTGGGGSSSGGGTGTTGGSTGGGGTTGGGTSPVLQLSEVSLTPNVLVRGHTATLRLRSSESAAITVTVSRLVRGREIGGRCATHGRGGRAGCVASIRRMTVRFAVGAQANSHQLGLGGLAPGRYVVSVTASAGASAQSTALALTVRPARHGR